MVRVAPRLLLLSLLAVSGCGTFDTIGAGSVLEPDLPLTPACLNPAPLLGEPNPEIPRFLVIFRATVNAEAETARLSNIYGFRPRHVFTLGPLGFSAELSSRVVAELRCIATIEHVEYVRRVAVP